MVAVGAQVMLCRNIHKNAGLANGAISTVVSVRWNHVTVQFDHINKQKAVSTDLSICCDHPQVLFICLSGLLRQSV